MLLLYLLISVDVEWAVAVWYMDQKTVCSFVHSVDNGHWESSKDLVSVERYSGQLTDGRRATN